jgi:GTP cyclohydrolase-4
MDRNFDDIPNQEPIHKIDIKRAGLIRENIPLTVLSPLSKRELVSLNCKLAVFTNIPFLKRGLHISRIGDIIACLSGKDYNYIEDFIKSLANEISKSQFNNESFIKLTAPFSFYEEVISKNNVYKKSLENIILIFSVFYKDNSFNYKCGIKFNNITACPCVQQTLKHSLKNYPLLKEDIEIPLLTHSQRCETKILIKNYIGYLDISKLLKVADLSTTRVQNTLPRDHELSMVYLAHKNPQFMEDVVRELANSTYNTFHLEYPEAIITIETKSKESIHDFNIQAKIVKRFKDFNL